MAERAIEDYAFRHGISNGEAKRRMRSGADSGERQAGDLSSSHSGPVAGTGKPKGVKKG